MPQRKRCSGSSDEDRQSLYEAEQSLKNAKLFDAIRKKQPEKTIIEEIKRCLDTGAQINAQNAKGKTILHIAVERNYKVIINFLLELRRPDIMIPDEDGKSALDLAFHGNNQDIIAILKTYEDKICSGDIDTVQENLKSSNYAKSNADKTNISDQINDEQLSSNLQGSAPKRCYTGRNADEATTSKRQCKEEILNNLEMPSEGLKLAEHGNIFQLKLLMLCLWHAANTNQRMYEQFRLATEMPEAEKFDDIVFQYKERNSAKWKFRLLQAKHKEKEKLEDPLPKITLSDLLSTDDKEDFSLQKYFHSYLKIKKRCEENSVYSVFSDSEIEDLIVITNTNFKLDKIEDIFSSSKSIKEDILFKTNKQDTLIYKLSEQNNLMIKRLKLICENSSDYYKLIESLAYHVFSNDKIDKVNLFKDYYFPLVHEIFEFQHSGGEGRKKEYVIKLNSFINGKNLKGGELSVEAKNIREALIKEMAFRKGIVSIPKIDETFGNCELPNEDGTLKALAEKLAKSIKENSKLIVKEFQNEHIALAQKVLDVENKKFKPNFIHEAVSPRNKESSTLGKFKGFLLKSLRNLQDKKDLKKYDLKLDKINIDVSEDFGRDMLPSDEAELKSLAGKLAEFIKQNKKLTVEDFQKEHVGLIAYKVIDKKTGAFSEIFKNIQKKMNGKIHVLSPETRRFRSIFLDEIYTQDIKIKIDTNELSIKEFNPEFLNKLLNSGKIKVSEGFASGFELEVSPELEELDLFAGQMKTLLDDSQSTEQKIIVINEEVQTKLNIDARGFRTFMNNIKKLAGYVLIKRFDKIHFSTSFIYSNIKLPGNLQDFKDTLQELLEANNFKSIYEFKFNIKGFKTWEDGEIYKKLPVVHIQQDITEFLEKLKFVVNYPNRMEISNLLGQNIEDKFRTLDSQAFQSRYYEDLHNWMADRVGTFYTVKEAKKLFHQIHNNLSLWTIDGFNKPYFADAKKYKFKKYTAFDNFLSNKIQQIFHLVFKDLSIGRTKIIQAFKQMQDTDSVNFQLYTRSCGHIFLYLKQLYDKNFRSEVYKVLEEKSMFNLIVIDCNSQHEIKELNNKLSDIILANSSKKVIFITQEKVSLAFKFATDPKYKEKYIKQDDVSSFKDFTEESQKQLLKQEVTFQGGKEKTNLEQLMGIEDLNNFLLQEEHQEKLNNIMDTETLIELVNSEEIKIGHNLPISPGYCKEYYICRQFNQQVILNKEKFLSDLRNLKEPFKSEFFVISSTDYLPLGDNVHMFSHDLIEPARNKFIDLCVENIASNIHWLNCDSKKITWNQSRGSIANLLKYREIDKVNKKNSPDISDDVLGTVDNEISEECLLFENQLVNLDNQYKTVIISDIAGMGKSTILTHLSLMIKNDHPNVWVICIDLNLYTAVFYQELEDRKSNKPKLSYQDIPVGFLLFLLNSQECSKLTTDLETKLFKNSFNGQSKIVLLFDGFDEISPDYEDIVVDLLQALNQLSIGKLFVTTRPIMRGRLEEKLGVFAHKLEPFSEEDQINFLTQYWKKKLFLDNLSKKDEERLNIYSNSLIQKFFSSINDTKFTAIPLHTMLIAEVFQNNQEKEIKTWQGCKEFLTSVEDKTPQLPEKLDLVTLYEHFIRRKFYDIHMKGKKVRDFTKTGEKRLVDEDYEDFKEMHMILALYRLFSEEDFNKLLSEKETEKLSSFIANIENAEKNEGIIDEIVNNKAHFIHITFAEYFTANFLGFMHGKDHVKAIQELVLTKILVKSIYKVIRSFLHEYNDQEKLDKVTWNEDMLKLLNIAFSYDDNTADEGNLLEKMSEKSDIRNIEFLFSLFKKLEYKNTIDELITVLCYTTALDNLNFYLIEILLKNVKTNEKLEILLHSENRRSLLVEMAMDDELVEYFSHFFTQLAYRCLTSSQIKTLFDNPEVWDNLKERNFEFIHMFESVLDERLVGEILRKYAEELRLALGMPIRSDRDTPDPEWYVLCVKYFEEPEEDYFE